MHAAIERVVDLRVRIDLLGHVATGDEDHGRRFRAALQHVEIALQLGALEGNLDALDGVGGELDHLFVVGEAAPVQVALLVVGLEHRMLGGGELRGGAVVELEGRHPVAGGFLFRRHALHALGDAADVLRDLGMALHARRKTPAVGVPVKDAAGFLDQIVENPLLPIAVQTGFTHGFNPPLIRVVGGRIEDRPRIPGVTQCGKCRWKPWSRCNRDAAYPRWTLTLVRRAALRPLWGTGASGSFAAAD